jgi:hypothetical protein
VRTHRGVEAVYWEQELRGLKLYPAYAIHHICSAAQEWLHGQGPVQGHSLDFDLKPRY